MPNVFVSAEYTRLDKGLKRSLRQIIEIYGAIRQELAERVPASKEALLLWRWAMFYVVVMEDVGNSADRLLVDGKRSRAALMLQRAAFEYYTRFHYYWSHPEHAKTAMDDYNPKMELFADRIGPDDITLIGDPNFDRAAHDAAKKPHKHFDQVCRDVYGADKWAEQYARFYSYPSALLHGDATMSMDVLELTDGRWFLHLDSRRPFTNEMGGNLIVSLLDLAGDVCHAFDLALLPRLKAIGADFNAARRRLGIEIAS